MKPGKISLKKWEHLPKRKKWWERRKLILRAMGISNRCYDPDKKKGQSVQFYDYDLEGGTSISLEHRKKIMSIFPYDCFMYKTKHGFHFISLALLKGYKTTKARAVQISKEMGNQDYWTTGRGLVLRVSQKWKKKKLRRKRRVISGKPQFFGVAKCPVIPTLRISNKHLEFYHKYMGLPDWVYHQYDKCQKFDFKIGITHYMTKD